MNVKLQATGYKVFGDFKAKITIIVPLMKIPNLRGYIINFAEPGFENPTYNAVVELWFDSEEDFTNGLQSKEGLAAIADQKNFLSGSPAYLSMQERTLIIPDRPEPGTSSKDIKQTYMMGINPNYSETEFLAAQFSDYAPTAINILREVFTGYEINYSQAPQSDLPISVVIHGWFSDKNEFMQRLEANPAAEKLGQLRDKYYINWSYMPVIEHTFISPMQSTIK